jgi:hypothetical protein
MTRLVGRAGRRFWSSLWGCRVQAGKPAPQWRLLLPAFCFFLATGCGESKDPSLYDRQEQAIKDPFSYNPDPKKSELSVTGDGDKDAMKRDVDHVFNP